MVVTRTKIESHVFRVPSQNQRISAKITASIWSRPTPISASIPNLKVSKVQGDHLASHRWHRCLVRDLAVARLLTAARVAYALKSMKIQETQKSELINSLMAKPSINQIEDILLLSERKVHPQSSLSTESQTPTIAVYPYGHGRRTTANLPTCSLLGYVICLCRYADDAYVGHIIVNGVGSFSFQQHHLSFSKSTNVYMNPVVTASIACIRCRGPSSPSHSPVMFPAYRFSSKPTRSFDRIRSP